MAEATLTGERPTSRRTQAERSAATRARLLEAALVCLVEQGYGATTTTLVAQVAGVSRGAQLHHYPTRALLVAAAIEHLFARLTSSYRRAFEELSAGDRRLDAAVDLLWSMFEAPEFSAVLELFIAARTDADLHAQLRPVAERHRSNVAVLAHRYFPELAADRARFETVLAMVLDAMHGMALSRLVYGESTTNERTLALLKETATAALRSA